MGIAETFLGILTGLGLSVACGFRVFIPLLVGSIAAQTGYLELSEGFDWLGEWPALTAFSAATVCEIIVSKFPGIDHMVDLIAAPLAAVAGTVLSASMFTDMSPFLHWSLAAIGGGGSAGLLHGGTAVLRGASSASTGGLGNPLFSIGEDAGAVSVPILAILVPVFVVFFFLALFVVTAFAIKWIVKRRRMPA